MNTIKAPCTLVTFQTYEKSVACLNIYGEYVTRPESRTYVNVGERVTAVNEENFVWSSRGNTTLEHVVSFTDIEPLDRYDHDLASLDNWLDEYAF